MRGRGQEDPRRGWRGCEKTVEGNSMLPQAKPTGELGLGPPPPPPPGLQLHYWPLFSSDTTACWGLRFTTLTGATSPSSWPMLIETRPGKRGLHHTRADLGPGAASGRSGTQGPPPSAVSCLVHGGHSAVERRVVGRGGEKELGGKEDCSLRHRTPDLGKRGTRPPPHPPPNPQASSSLGLSLST